MVLLAAVFAVWLLCAAVVAVFWSRFHADIRARRTAGQQHYEEAA